MAFLWEKAFLEEYSEYQVFFFGFYTVIFGYLLYKIKDMVNNLLSEWPTDSTGQEDISRRERTRCSPHECPICYEDAQLAVETKCGHVFCSDCLLEVWRRSTQPILLCPYCRQRVTAMLPYFSDEENNTADPALADDRARLVKEMEDFSRRKGEGLCFRVGIVVAIIVRLIFIVIMVVCTFNEWLQYGVRTFNI